ncbi:MAG: hypothetical protein IJN64_13540 [Lachnospiraceae bacterium]|nr:hypothetical protein [Lachnospiraceae bacterium]
MDRTQILKEKIADAELVLIGIGEEFNENFGKINQYPSLMKGLEEIDSDESIAWAVPFLEKVYLEKEKESQTVQAYRNLYELVKEKNYFVVTTCIDGHIENAGFNIEKIVEPCGNYGKLQCSEKCCSELYDSTEVAVDIKNRLESSQSLEGIEQPVCPHCGKPMAFNNIVSENYVEEGYLPQWEKYTKWLQGTVNKKLCILEFGAGMQLPGIIRWPFEKVAFYNQKASFFRINEKLYQLTEEIGEKGISIERNACEYLLEELK